MKDILEGIQKNFSTYGNGQTDQRRNSVADQLQHGPLVFALGVNVEEVVKFITDEYKKRIKRMIAETFDKEVPSGVACPQDWREGELLERVDAAI